MEVRNHTLSLIVNNKPDVLARIAGIFSGRGFNIENISANVTLNPAITKITIVTRGDTATVIKIKKQLVKLVDVVSVAHLENGNSFRRELVLFRVALDDSNKDDIMQTAQRLECTIIAWTDDSCIVEYSGTTEEVEKTITELSHFAIKDMSRSGIVAL